MGYLNIADSEIYLGLKITSKFISKGVQAFSSEREILVKSKMDKNL
jgi:hypothetical protein